MTTTTEASTRRVPPPARPVTGVPQSSGEIQALLEQLGSWPYLEIERHSGCVILRTRELVVGTLDLEVSDVWVDVPPYAVGPELDGHAGLRRTSRGASVKVGDGESRLAAE